MELAFFIVGSSLSAILGFVVGFIVALPKVPRKPLFSKG